MAEIEDYVGQCASLAALLEVSAYPKPGNVHRLRDFEGTTYEHFLASSIAIAPWMGKLASRCKKVASQGLEFSEVGVGRNILGATEEMFRWQAGGNVHLGIILLFSPISAAAGIASEGRTTDPIKLRHSLTRILRSTTPVDAADIYKAINMAMSKENLGSQEELDVTDPRSIEKILKNNVTPVNIFELCMERDSICSEWVTGFKITFEEGYPYLASQLTSNNVNDSILNTFLMIMSLHPDSLVTRKKGLKEAEKLGQKAGTILEAGGAGIRGGKRMLFRLDKKLQKENGLMNPGTTADLTAASLFVLLLTGWRP